MRHKAPDLLLLAGLTIAACAVMLSSVGGSVARVAFGLPLALILPGYALTAALFPTRQIGAAERLSLTVGSSLAGLALVGLGLNWTPWGLTVPSWTTSLGGLTLAATLLALMRRPPRPAERVIRPTAKIAAHQWAVAGVSGVVLILAFMVARAGALEQHGDGFTQLWMLPDGRPTANQVHIGITSQERSVVDYRLELQSGTEVLRTWPSIELEPGATWQATATVTPAGKGVQTAAVLFRLDLPDRPYRQVVLGAR